MVSIDVRIVIGCGDVMGWWWNKFICRPIGKFRSHMLLVLLWLLFVLYIIQKTNICCRQTGSQVRSQRALWVNRWSTSQITAWRGRAWSSTRSRLNPPCTTSNMTMTSTSTSTIWWRPPSTDCPVSSSAHGSSLTRPVLQPLKCYRCQISSSRGGPMCWRTEALFLFSLNLMRFLSVSLYKTRWSWFLILSYLDVWLWGRLQCK